MLIKTITKNTDYSERVKKCGLRRIAEITGIAPSNLSNYVNDKKVCNKETLDKILEACREIENELPKTFVFEVNGKSFEYDVSGLTKEDYRKDLVLIIKKNKYLIQFGDKIIEPKT